MKPFIEFSVSDTGIGIKPEDQKRIFERFEQGDGTASKKFQGTGLGLPIAREIVRLHGGSLSMESEPGAGSTFTVELPIASSTETAETAGTTDGAISDS